MPFLALPREIRNLIYTHLTTKRKTYTVTSAGITPIGDSPQTTLGLINTCKTIQYELLEILSPKNTFRFSFPWPDKKTQSLYHELAALIPRIDFYIDLSPFPWQNLRFGHLDPAVYLISQQVCEVLRAWNEHAVKRKHCRIIIRDNTSFVSSLLQLEVFEVVKDLVELKTLSIMMLKYKTDIRKVGAFLGPSLGPSTLWYEWPVIPDADVDYGCVKFYPRAWRLHSARQERLMAM